MAKKNRLITLEPPREGEDFFELWRKVKALIQAINHLSIKIVPANFGSVRIQQGNIQFNWNPDAIRDALRALNTGPNPPDKKPDLPGGGGPPPDPIFGTQHVDCRIGQQNQVFTAPISYVCYDVGDYGLVYDNRANMNLLFTATISSLGTPNVGQVVYFFGIAFGREPADTINMGNVCGGPGQPACPPASCYPPPTARLRCTLYACDYTTGYGPPGG